MNYGFGPESPQWDVMQSFNLATALRELVKDYVDKNGMQPYVEENGLYMGVTIRRLTHLTKEEIDTITTKADEIYDKIMKGGYHGKGESSKGSKGKRKEIPS